ncbi:hypothetical protein RN001_011450 [Aquatica leii]|uniref:SCAN domain-containing protein 3 n=1 Tax=Aquatica leii TaxID=1421715 RepID=A0AAN7QDV5_9COLE|nr:hypothetical protein RN001_011450 [Aquatica leii]
MVGRYRRFISYLKQNVSGVLAIDCVIHRQHLVAKNLSVRLHESLQLVIDATNCQENDVSTYVQHLNALYSDFETRFEDILTMVIPTWIINPYGDIEETNVIIQEKLTEVQTKNLRFSLKTDISNSGCKTTYLLLIPYYGI